MGKYRKYNQADHKALGSAAVKWAERVLPFFEHANPDDRRPREALKACRAWLRSGVFRMADIRGASLGAHAAARGAQGGDLACWAARAAGQAVATAHVPQHAYGAALYALKAVAAAPGADALTRTEAERQWQSRCLPPRLRRDFLAWVQLRVKSGRITVTIDKTQGF